jgi:hypothetical protein
MSDSGGCDGLPGHGVLASKVVNKRALGSPGGDLEPAPKRRRFTVVEATVNHSVVCISVVAKNCLSVDYRCEDGRFSVLTSGVTTSNLDLLSSSERGVHFGMRS